MKTFIKLDNELLANTGYTLTQKVIISKIKGFQDNDMYCFETQENLSIQLCIPLRTLKRDIKTLCDNGIIFKEKKSLKDNKHQFKNRKVIVFVDDNNPLPIKEAKIAKPIVQHEAKPQIVEPTIDNDTKLALRTYLESKRNELPKYLFVDLTNQIESETVITISKIDGIIKSMQDYDERSK